MEMSNLIAILLQYGISIPVVISNRVTRRSAQHGSFSSNTPQPPPRNSNELCLALLSCLDGHVTETEMLPPV